MTEFLDALQRVLDETVAPEAPAVDRDGTFPRRSLDALGAAGILGLTTSAELGGGGQGMRQAAEVVQRLAGTCGSTAMVVLMHYTAVAAIEGHGPKAVRKAVAGGQHLSTLAFSEAGSRSHFWVPMGTATPGEADVRLDARKSWVTSAGEADSYVWSSRPLDGDGPMTLWLVASDAPGLSIPARFDGMGLRGNASSPVTADGVTVAATAMLGIDGGGLDLAFATVLPWFLVLNSAASLGLMESLVTQTTTHLTATRFEHLGQSLAQQPAARAGLARMRVLTDAIRTLINDTVNAVAHGRPEAQLRVLEVKAASAETAIEVSDLAMTTCGGSAFRADLGIERRFRDARAARVMAPTTEASLDFIGRALCGLPLMDGAAA